MRVVIWEWNLGEFLFFKLRHKEVRSLHYSLFWSRISRNLDFWLSPSHVFFKLVDILEQRKSHLTLRLLYYFSSSFISFHWKLLLQFYNTCCFMFDIQNLYVIWIWFEKVWRNSLSESFQSKIILRFLINFDSCR